VNLPILNILLQILYLHLLSHQQSILPQLQHNTCTFHCGQENTTFDRYSSSVYILKG